MLIINVGPDLMAQEMLSQLSVSNGKKVEAKIIVILQILWSFGKRVK
jgi:hypothetical protein